MISQMFWPFYTSSDNGSVHYDYNYWRMFSQLDRTPSVVESGSRVLISGIDARSLYRFIKLKYSASGFLYRFFTLTSDKHKLSISRFCT